MQLKVISLTFLDLDITGHIHLLLGSDDDDNDDTCLWHKLYCIMSLYLILDLTIQLLKLSVTKVCQQEFIHTI